MNFTPETCPTCGKADEVEDSISPEKYDGYCYRCGAPFKVTDECGWPGGGNP